MELAHPSPCAKICQETDAVQYTRDIYNKKEGSVPRPFLGFLASFRGGCRLFLFLFYVVLLFSHFMTFLSLSHVFMKARSGTTKVSFSVCLYGCTLLTASETSLVSMTPVCAPFTLSSPQWLPITFEGRHVSETNAIIRVQHGVFP